MTSLYQTLINICQMFEHRTWYTYTDKPTGIGFERNSRLAGWSLGKLPLVICVYQLCFSLFKKTFSFSFISLVHS